MRNLVRFARLPRRERATLVRALLWVVLARLAIVGLPFRVARRWFATKSRTIETGLTLEQARRAILAASRRVPGTHCLARSLALQGMLRDTPLPVELRIGVARRAGDCFVAHAWLVCEGLPVLPGESLDDLAVLPLGDIPS